METDRFKQDNLDLIENVGLWSVPTMQPMKRWSNEQARYEVGLLRFRESDGAYVFYPGLTLATFQHGAAGMVVSKVQIEQLIEDGWMVD